MNPRTQIIVGSAAIGIAIGAIVGAVAGFTAARLTPAAAPTASLPGVSCSPQRFTLSDIKLTNEGTVIGMVTNGNGSACSPSIQVRSLTSTGAMVAAGIDWPFGPVNMAPGSTRAWTMDAPSMEGATSIDARVVEAHVWSR